MRRSSAHPARKSIAERGAMYAIAPWDRKPEVVTAFDCAAVIGTKDRPRELAASLTSLAAANPAFREVIVADQGANEMPPLPAGLPVVYLKLERIGLAYARNQALKRATAEWVYFPDD